LSTVLSHVIFGLPLLLEPCGFHCSAILVISLCSFRNVCPIHRHFLSLISRLIGLLAVMDSRSSLLIMFGQNMLHILLRHRLTEARSFLYMVVVTFHVSLPYMRTLFTLVLNTRSFVRREISDREQTKYNVCKCTGLNDRC